MPNRLFFPVSNWHPVDADIWDLAISCLCERVDPINLCRVPVIDKVRCNGSKVWMHAERDRNSSKKE
ncbi:unnamed protein product [Amaranthus hypochondriacus]